MQPADPAAFLITHLSVVDSVVADVARRHRVQGDDLGEFRSLAYLKLVDRDYEALRQFRGQSSLRTYLTVVLQRVLLDQRNRQWGRWRPSAVAQRTGPLAVQLERLVTRDGLTPEEAVASLGGQVEDGACVGFLQTLRNRRIERGDRRPLGEGAIPDRIDSAPGPEERAHRHELHAQAPAVQARVRRALRALDSQDHLIITLRFRDGLAVPDIARMLGIAAKPLYRRIGYILERLQGLLSADARAEELVRCMAADMWSDLAPLGESGWWGPSIPASDTKPTPARPRPPVPCRRSAGGVYRRTGNAFAQSVARAASV